MGFSGDFRFEKLDFGKVRIRDRYTGERIGDICLNDDDVSIVRRKK